MISVDEARGRADRRRFTELPYLLFHDEPRWAGEKNIDSFIAQHEFDHLNGILFTDKLVRT